MPIKRLQRQAQFPCIGKLRKGGKKRPGKNGKEQFGEDLTYFRFDTEDERAAKMFAAAYGPEPDTIAVYLPYPTTAENFSAWQEDWLAGGLQHRCDGETCVMWLDTKIGSYHTSPKPCPGGCKPVGRLMVIIPELQRFAYVNVETHSQWDIMTLEENLLAVESLRGNLQGIPFILKRRPREISTPGPDGKRMRREKWLLSIEVDPAWAAVQLEYMHRAALTVGVVDEGHMLPVADDEIDVDMAEVEEDTAGHMATPHEEPVADADDGEFSVLPWQDWTEPGNAYEWAEAQGIDAKRSGAEFASIVKTVGKGKYGPDTSQAIFRAFYERMGQAVPAEGR